MIVSALATAVGINLGLTVLLAAAYSLLRRREPYAAVYSPRPTAAASGEAWLAAAWRRSEAELHDAAGLDGVVFIRIIVFSLRVFAVAAAVGICVLLPVNYWGDQLRDVDLSDLPNKSVDFFSVSNVKDGSNRLWFHFSAAYIITGVVCYLLYIEYKYIAAKRLEYFMSSKLLPQHFTILVRSIPLHDGGSVSDTVEKFFTEYHPSTYLSHTVVYQTSKLRRLLTDTENIYGRLTHIKSGRSNSDSEHTHHRFLGLFGRKDLVGQYQKKLEDLEENVRMEQSDTSRTRQEIPAAFVCFRSRYGAANAVSIRQSDNPTEWQAEQAPEPRDVYWPFFSTSFIERWISKLVVFVASILLIIVFLLVAAFVQGLTYMEQLEKWLPFLKKILEIAVVSQIITGYLPSLILNSLSSCVPPIMKIFSTMEGFISYSGIEKSACNKMLRFTIWSVFFANVLTGSVIGELQIFLDPKEIPSRLAVLVPAQAAFFIAYVVTSWTSVSSELTRPMTLICHLLGYCARCCKTDESEVQSIPYHSEIPRILLFGLLGLTYFIVAPLILPFILVYFCLGYFIYRNQLFNVYFPKYETGGRFWPVVHNTTIFSLLLMHIIAIGVFGLKKLPLASTMIVPLPLLTLLFNEYCRNRFLPVFKAYSAESLIKKDREDHSNPETAEFFSSLVTAYSDPALVPIQRTSSLDDRRTPLLSPT